MSQRARFARLTLALALGVSATVAAPARPAEALNTSITWSMDPNNVYSMGIDYIPGSAASYEQFYEWPIATNPIDNKVAPNPIIANRSVQQIRMEIYRRGANKNYSPWEDDSAVAVRIGSRPGEPTPPAKANVGPISFPSTSDANTAKLVSTITSRSPIATGRVTLTIFQTEGQRATGTGYLLDAFSHGQNRDNRIQTGPLWNGQYIAFIVDHAAARTVTGLLNLKGTTRIDFDLDALCFGIQECEWAGTMPAVDGKFHPVATSRIVDTRRNLGIVGAVSPGDGRSGNGNLAIRTAEGLNHEFKVTGVGGVPARGVSAVLINVAATGTAATGGFTLYPRPPRRYIFDPQTSFIPTPPGQQLNWTTGDTIANLALVRVGVDGRIRVSNTSPGHAHLIVDVIGWFDEAQPGQSGLGLVPLTSQRVVDSRTGLGTEKRALGTNETRLITARSSGVPATANLAVATIAAVTPTSRTYMTVWSAGQPRPNTATINVPARQNRANLAAAPLSAAGQWNVYNAVGNAHVVADVTGYFDERPGAGGRVTALAPASVYSAAVGAMSTTAIAVAGRGGVPPTGAKAVLLNVTVAQATAPGYATVYAAGTAAPLGSNLNWAPGATRSNLVLVPVGAGGAVNVKLNSTGGARLQVHVVGWVRP